MWFFYRNIDFRQFESQNGHVSDQWRSPTDLISSCFFLSQSHPFVKTYDGFNYFMYTLGCDQYVTLGGVPAGTTCHLYDFCTGVRCCSDIPLLDRSINTWLILDHCNYKLSVGFEKLSINVSLHDYEMGKEEDVIINGVFRIQ